MKQIWLAIFGLLAITSYTAGCAELRERNFNAKDFFTELDKRAGGIGDAGAGSGATQ